MAERKSAEVRLTPRFLAEFGRQIEWIAERNLRAAEAAEARVRVALRRLGRFPELGRIGRIEGTRELSVPRTRFIIAYRVRAGVVEIAALLHAAQSWPDQI
ncbi:MAG TPA: type II toxin-antitoxin system RelE/ParE family toxin [Terricaulis sp.]|nr:type II toxin-antitoxin system RelE/ParE family toxin [Terricaulis sp.]HRP10646.1 type II toxin-antitoxin system RelE/ParE family toxin [Terricaulis sp.]